MTSTRVLNQAGGSLALTLFLLLGCNAIVGLDKLEVTNDPADSAGADNGGQANTGGGSSAGKGGDGNNEAGSGAAPDDVPNGEGGEGGEAPQGDCTTNQECTDRLSEEAMGEAGGTGTTVVAAAWHQVADPALREATQ